MVITYLWHNDTGSRSANFNQFDVKDQVFTSQGVISIEHNSFLSYFGDHNRNDLSGSIGHIQTLTYFELQVIGKFTYREFNHHIGVLGTICFFYWYLNSFFVAHLHSHHAIVESGDDHTTAYFKLKRFTAGRGVKSSTIC